jgi:biopolymer transport protein ExbD
MAYKPKAGAVMAAPNVIPMADVMLVLLIIFMVVTPMLQKGFSVDMAHVTNPADLPDADKDDAIIVAVTRDGKVYVGTTQTPKDQLTDVIKDQVSSKIDKTIFIRSDGRAKYGDVAAVVDEVRNAGVDKVGLLTERVERTRMAPPPPTGQ